MKVFLTGADRGVGYALCEEFLQGGHTVLAGQYMPQWPQLQALQQRYPDSDKVMFLLGRLHTALDHAAEGMEWYTRCAAVTRNGLIRMELPAEAMQAAKDRK
jgi:NAD(P)-dependent dehydrogenase (short-subunit alcohol dehydrogenase family)